MANIPEEAQKQLPPGNINRLTEEPKKQELSQAQNPPPNETQPQSPSTQESQQPKQTTFGKVMDATAGGFARWLHRGIENRFLSENVWERQRLIADREKVVSQDQPQPTTNNIAQGQGSPKTATTLPNVSGSQQSSNIPPEVLRYKKELVDKPFENLDKLYKNSLTTTPADEIAYRQAKENWEKWQKPEYQKLAAEIFAVGGRSPEAISVYNKAREDGKSHSKALAIVQEWAKSYKPPKSENIPNLRTYNIYGLPDGSVVYDPKTGTAQVTGISGLDPGKWYQVMSSSGRRLPQKEGDSFIIAVPEDNRIVYKTIQVAGGDLRKLDTTNRLKVSQSGLLMWGNEAEGFVFVSEEMAKKLVESENRIAAAQRETIQKAQDNLVKNTLEAQKLMLTNSQKLVSDTEARIAKGETTLEGSIPVYINYMKEANKYFRMLGQQEPFQMFDQSQWDILGPYKVNREVVRDPLTGMPLVQLRNKATKEVRIWKFSRGQ